MQKSPCINCLDRAVSCHSSCETYKEWLKALKKERAEIAKLRELEKTLNVLCRN